MQISSMISNSTPSHTELLDFKYRILNPNNRPYELSKVWTLAANNLKASGDVSNASAIKAVQDRNYDLDSNTRILCIYHSTGRLAGTLSMTIDSHSKMPVDRFFPEEIDFLRQHCRLVNGWRFSMSPFFQSRYLRQKTLAHFLQFCWANHADAFVLYYNERLQKYYDRVFKGEVISEKLISLDGNQKLPVRLMLCHAKHNQPEKKYLEKGIINDYNLVYN